MKKCYVFVLLIVALILGSCGAPDTKKAYLEKFEAFVADVSRSCKTYSEKDWEKAVEKYEKYAGEWYDKFKDDFTIKDKFKITGYHAKFNYCRTLDKAVTDIQQLFESINVKKIKDQIQYYIDNDMDDGLKKLVEEAGKAGSEAKRAVDKVLDELDVDIKKLDEDKEKGKMDKLVI